MSQPFARLLWYDWFHERSWYPYRLLDWVYPGIFPSFWPLASCWSPYGFWKATWVKGNIPWICRIYITIPACGASCSSTANFSPPPSSIFPTLPWWWELKAIFSEVKVDTKFDILSGLYRYGVFWGLFGLGIDGSLVCLFVLGRNLFLMVWLS